MCSIAPNGKEVVTSVGNSWIICRSKSCAGRIYYFNTSTGDAVWNLSETEVEKAKNRTKILQSQPDFTIGDCPEPPVSPKDDSTMEKQPSLSVNNLGSKSEFSQQKVPPKIYDKQIINNQFTLKSPTQCSNLQYHQCNLMNPTQFDVPFVPTICPALWNDSPQRIFVTPTFNQPQPLFKNSNFEQVNVNNKAETLSNRFKKYAETSHKHTKQSGVFKYQYHKRLKSHGYRFQKAKNNVDLRLLLSLKKRENIINEKESYQMSTAAATYIKDKHSEIKQYGIPHQPFKIRKRSYSYNPTEVEDDNRDDMKWQNLSHEHSDIEQGGINQLPIYSRRGSYSFNTKDDDGDKCFEEEDWNSQGDTKPLEMEVLRNLFEMPENYNVWYIVTDSNVLINNIHLLNNILKADKQCRLMVPQQIIDKIQSATNSRLRLLAHRTLYFIFRQVEANLAIIDKSSEEILNSNDGILHCCAQLVEKGNHVVLLTDDIELHNNSNTSNILIFTVAEIKHLVKESKSNEIPIKNLDTAELAGSRNIKITIENESNIEYDGEASEKIMNPEIVLGKGTCEKLLQIDKKACDVGVQADSVSLPKISDDINNEIILPDSTKANDSLSCNLSRVQRHLSRDLSSKTKKTDKMKVWQRHKLQHALSMNDYHAKVDDVVTSICPITDSSSYENAHSYVGNSAWGLCSHTSTESLNKHSPERNEMSSETSSFTVIRNVNKIENVTIDETSTSGMSNTTSIVDTGSESGFQKAKKEEDTNVMFEVTDVRMEQFLRMKADEWVSRLVQIMEEALSQVLRLQPSGTLEHMPPPWTVHEAAECVKKFHHDSDVVDAANKFLRISLENGGLRGKIKSSISPHKFMELYSYGVYLIDALQGVLIENEDLQTAAESLSKLLSDIQDPHLDPSNQDSFNDISAQENEAEVAEDNDTSKGTVNPDDNNNKKKTESPKTKKNKSTVVSPGKYNLRSQRQKSIEVKQHVSNNVNVTNESSSIIESESSFFSSLYLKKISNLTSDSEITNEEPNPNNGLGTSDDIQDKNRSPSLHTKEENMNTSEEITAKIVNEQPKINEQPKLDEPKIIRNFSVCPKYEEKLKSKSVLFSDFGADTSKEFEGSMTNYDEEDYAEDYYGMEEYNMENEYYHIDYNDDVWYDLEQIPEDTEVNSSLPISENVHINTANKTLTFKNLMEKFEKDMQRAYSSIQDFCVKSCESLQTPDLSADDKSQMQLRAEKTCLYIHQICDQLNSVLTRENSEHSIFQILRRKEFEDIVVEDNDMEVYRNFISNCLEQGNVLMGSVTLVLEASKEQTG